MKQKTKTKKRLIRLAIDFVKLQVAGNVLFWGTYAGYWLLNNVYGWTELSALMVASSLAHVLFFIVDKEWVFVDKTGRRKPLGEVVRFLAFMGFNYVLNIAIIQSLWLYAGIVPEIGQFIAALFFTAWSFIGLRFWVFPVPQHHAVAVRASRKGGTNGR